MIFFDQPVKNELKTYVNIWKIKMVQWDGYTISFLLDYPYFKNYFKTIAVDLSKEQALDADPKEIHQINFTGNLDWAATMFFLMKKQKKPFWDRESVVNLFRFNMISI